jgi:hypothetical protein
MLRHFALLISAWATLAFATPASAGADGCDEHNIREPADRLRLEGEVAKFFPAGIQIGAAQTTYCRNRDYASADVQSARRSIEGGAVEWWQIDCDRGPLAWRCRTPRHRRLIDWTALIAGRKRDITLTLDDALPLESARALALEAVTRRLQPVEASRACTEGNVSQTARKAFGPSSLQRDIPVRIYKDPRDPMIETPNEIIFHVREGAAGDDRLCWEEWIVITAD